MNTHHLSFFLIVFLLPQVGSGVPAKEKTSVLKPTDKQYLHDEQKGHSGIRGLWFRLRFA